MKTAKDLLLKRVQHWFSDDVEMVDETSFISFSDALEAMEEYAELFNQKPKTNQWGVSDPIDFTKNAGRRD